MNVVYAESDSPWMHAMARDIINLLDLAYPGWGWSVKVYGDEKGGGYHIRLLNFEGGNYGYNNPRAHLFASASELRANVLRAGGELLERCLMSRQLPCDPEAPGIQRMEGVPEKFQGAPDPDKVPKIQLETVIKTADHNLRETPRGQVTEALKDGQLA
jgi:hypothetical protein